MDLLAKTAGPVALAAAVLMTLAPGARAAPAVHTIVIDGMRFIPRTVVVKRGDTVVWRNKDPFPHTATAAAAAGGPDSPVIAAGGSWRFRAAKPGRYPYLCTLHRTMAGTLVVK